MIASCEKTFLFHLRSSMHHVFGSVWRRISESEQFDQLVIDHAEHCWLSKTEVDYRPMGGAVGL